MQPVSEGILFLVSVLVALFIYSSNQYGVVGESDVETEENFILLEPSTVELIAEIKEDDFNQMDLNDELSFGSALPQLKESSGESGWLRNVEQFFGHMAVVLLNQRGVIPMTENPSPTMDLPIPTCTPTTSLDPSGFEFTVECTPSTPTGSGTGSGDPTGTGVAGIPVKMSTI